MKKLALLLLVLLVAITSAAAQEMDVFEVVGDGAVVPHGNKQYADPGAALYHDGQFHMFYNAFSGWPSEVDIKYATSADGITWEIQNDDDPVFVGDDLDYAGLTVLASSALVEADGTWVLYFYIWDSFSPMAKTAVGRATASAPTGPWTADDAPVLVQGSEGEWDDHQVSSPSVIKTEDGYVMYYTGTSGDRVSHIGMATSEDGITWTKYDDPVTTDAPYAESDPVLMGWENVNINQPRVELTPDGYVMLLKMVTFENGRPTVPGGMVSYATSKDGITWELAEDKIAVTPSSVPNGRAIWFTELVYQADTYYLFFELGTGTNTEVYVATYEGMLP